jgi:hypothetical protein
MIQFCLFFIQLFVSNCEDNNFYVLLTEDDLDQFIETVIEAHKAGVTATKNISNVPNWSFGQSFFFATSVLTTIGIVEHSVR